jgi:hypothetical protein
LKGSASLKPFGLKIPGQVNAVNKSCKYVVMPVVTNALNVKSENQVIAFACMKILSASQAQKTVSVQMANGCKAMGSGGSGTTYGVVTPAKLVQ